MGRHDVHAPDERAHAAFTRLLLRDLQALEQMIAAGRIESGVRRIGAEQEMFLVDRLLEPAPLALALLADLQDARLTTELAQFNLEANATPRVLRGDCLRALHREMDAVLAAVAEAAARRDARVGLVGILPTLRQHHARLENMTPALRYSEINRAVVRERGGCFEIRIRGVDELETTHDNVMLESCNTSFQVHLQVGADEFARFYNAAQLVTAPLLAAAANAPVFLGKRLWAETRVALFERAVDSRSSAQVARGLRPRVWFGDAWVRESVLEIFRDDVTRHRVLVVSTQTADALAQLAQGELPSLDALQLHNGTVYRWNRPCYGVAGGVAHLRIENRALPAGPSVADEVANAAVFCGAVCALAAAQPRLADRIPFDDAKASFFAAARHGLESQIVWLDGRAHAAADVLLHEVLPAARDGLREAGVDADDVTRYVDIVMERVQRRRTGARWMLDSLAAMPPARAAQRFASLTAAMLEHQRAGEPVHRWPLATLDTEAGSWRQSLRTVGQIMSTDLFTVRPGDVVDLAASIMTWERVRHVPVEDAQGRLVGLISYWALLRLVASGGGGAPSEPVHVEAIMRPSPVTATPDTPTLQAIELMQKHRISCLPVVEDERLVGIVSERDLIQLTRRLLEDHLRDGSDSPSPL